MSDFTASNGIPVSITGDGWLMTSNADHTNPAVVAAGEHVEAIAEFFRAREDDRLGRWRWSENPDITVRVAPKHAQRAGNDGTVMIQQDSDGYVGYYDRGSLPEITERSGAIVRAGRAYFDAHPEPKPWHDAKPDEGWLLTIDGDERVAVRGRVEDFIHVKGATPWSSPTITAGRRIWPEVAS